MVLAGEDRGHSYPGAPAASSTCTMDDGLDRLGQESFLPCSPAASFTKVLAVRTEIIPILLSGSLVDNGPESRGQESFLPGSLAA
jgi:hypothetical protein